MKKLIIPILMMFLLIGSVMAEDITMEGNTKGADPLSKSFWQKITGLFQQQTALGGSSCSILPDYESRKVYPSSQTKVCWRNQDGGSPALNGREHDGVVFQLFALSEWTHGIWVIEDEVNILAGERKCLDIPSGGYELVINAYYCDGSDATSCDDIDFRTICHTDTETKKVRTCPNNEPEVVWIKGIVPNTPYCAGYPKDEDEPEPTCTKTCSGNYNLNKDACKCICGLSPNDCDSDEYLKNCECQAEPQDDSCDRDCDSDEYLDMEDCKCYFKGEEPKDEEPETEITEEDCDVAGMDFEDGECIERETPKDVECEEGTFYDDDTGSCLEIQSCDLTEEDCESANAVFNEDTCKCEEDSTNPFTDDNSKYITWGIITLVGLLIFYLVKKK